MMRLQLLIEGLFSFSQIIDCGFTINDIINITLHSIGLNNWKVKEIHEVEEEGEDKERNKKRSVGIII